MLVAPLAPAAPAAAAWCIIVIILTAAAAAATAAAAAAASIHQVSACTYVEGNASFKEIERQHVYKRVGNAADGLRI